MGANGSKAEQTRLKTDKSKVRQYRLPSVRQKDRYDAAESTNFNTPYEASIDKFDYLIVFPLTEGPYVHPIIKDEQSKDSNDRISWERVKFIWQSAVPGTDVKKNHAIDDLKKIWNDRTGSDPVDEELMRKNAWLTIARETIVDQLSNKCGLQLKLTANSEFIFCRVRAPIKLLELQADKDNYPLQLRGEIDPGSEAFWNVEVGGHAVEIEEEKRLLSLDEAKTVLERLYRAGKISPNDIGIIPDCETQSAFSRRVHALERIADKVPVSNKFVAYASFLSSKPHLRFLYQTYPSVRGHTLFRSKDRLLLTKSIIYSAADIELLVSYGVVHAFLALHDANRGEKLTVDSLARRWTTFWSSSAAEVGAPTVTHPAYEEGEELWWFERPFAQPLGQVREYFGEKVAIYFAWMGFFTYYLTWPALLGCGAELLYYLRGYQDADDTLDWAMYAYALLMLTWAVHFDQAWKAECKAVALKWGTRGFEAEEKDRPQFRGDEAQPIQRSVITNRNETSFPDGRRTCLTIGSYIVIVLLVILDSAALLGIFYVQSVFLTRNPLLYGSVEVYFGVSIVVAVFIQLASALFRRVAVALNDNENQRTDTAYEDALVVKILTFELFNSFSACAFAAFAKDAVFHSCLDDDCIYDLRMLLYAVILVRLLRRLLDVIVTATRGYFRKQQERNGGSGMGGGAGKKEELQSLISNSGDAGNEDLQFLAEFRREEFGGTFHDFAEAYLQFGYIALFCTAMPLLPVICLLENLVKLRTDAYSLCVLCRRPHVEQCEDAGYWSENLRLMIVLGAFMSAALFVFGMADMEQYSRDTQVIVFLAAAMAALLYIYFLQQLLPEEPEYVAAMAARQQFVVDKFVKGFEDDDEGLLDAAQLKGHLDDTVDVDGLNLYDLRKGQAVSDADYTQMEALERERRELQRELKMTKDRLQDVYKTETFNENSGVGETKHGLPLGRVSVKLLEIQDLSLSELDLRPADFDHYCTRPNGPPLPVKLRVSFVGTKPGAPAPAPGFGALAETPQLGLDSSGIVVINRVLGPFAPIRTVDADVVFDVMFQGKNADPQKVATASISLRDLADQTQQNKILPLRIKLKDGSERQSGARLYATLTFQYSKVVPIRSRVYVIQDKLQTLERELSRLKAGRK